MTPRPTPRQPDTFETCFWGCRKCDKFGEVNVWVRAGETAQEAATRQQGSTRGACVTGCALLVLAGERAAHAKMGAKTNGDHPE